jgi:hypothetical protein
VPAGQSYSAVEKESEDDSKNESVVGDKSEEGEKENELPDPSRPRPGVSVMAVYEGQWFLAKVTSNQADVAPGYTHQAQLRAH